MMLMCGASVTQGVGQNEVDAPTQEVSQEPVVLACDTLRGVYLGGQLDEIISYCQEQIPSDEKLAWYSARKQHCQETLSSHQLNQKEQEAVLTLIEASEGDWQKLGSIIEQAEAEKSNTRDCITITDGIRSAYRILVELNQDKLDKIISLFTETLDVVYANLYSFKKKYQELLSSSNLNQKEQEAVLTLIEVSKGDWGTVEQLWAQCIPEEPDTGSDLEEVIPIENSEAALSIYVDEAISNIVGDVLDNLQSDGPLSVAGFFQSDSQI